MLAGLVLGAGVEEVNNELWEENDIGGKGVSNKITPITRRGNIEAERHNKRQARLHAQAQALSQAPRAVKEEARARKREKEKGPTRKK